MDESAPPPPEGTSGSSASRQGASPWQLMGLGVQFLGALLVCVAAGVWLDRRIGSGPWGVLGGLALAGGVFFRLVRPFLAGASGGKSGTPSGGRSAK